MSNYVFYTVSLSNMTVSNDMVDFYTYVRIYAVKPRYSDPYPPPHGYMNNNEKM